VIADEQFRHALLGLPTEERRSLASMLVASLPDERLTRREKVDRARREGVARFLASGAADDSYYSYYLWARGRQQTYYAVEGDYDRAAGEIRAKRDPEWERKLSALPPGLERSVGANIVVASSVLLDVVGIPRERRTTGEWKRLARTMRGLGWRRKPNGLVKAGKAAVSGYYRERPPS
jgi:hypothetical protein